MLKAYIIFFPVLSAFSFTTFITASTRSLNDELADDDNSSSSLIKSIPASANSETIEAVSSGDNPIEGLIIVPIKGRSYTLINERQPSIPNAGPSKCSAKEDGKSISINLSPVNCFISYKLPCKVETITGRL